MEIERGTTFDVDSQTPAREFVRHFGEPTKKGGGQSTFIPPFLEWSSLSLLDSEGNQVDVGVMIELRDPKGSEILSEEQQKKGAGGLWDRAASWTWSGLKLFKAGSSA